MLNASIIFYDLNNVVVAWVVGAESGSVNMKDCTAATVSDIPDRCAYATHKYDPETGEIYVNPDYETETAAGKEYVINVGWVYPEENGDE